MEKQLTIKYNWICDQGIEIPVQHERALTEDAEVRIFEMITDGYLSGELSTSVRCGKEIVVEEDEDSGLTYSGHWSAFYNH